MDAGNRYSSGEYRIHRIFLLSEREKEATAAGKPVTVQRSRSKWTNNQDEPGTSHKIVVTDAEWAEVTSVVNDAFDHFVVRLRQAYPQLGEKEIGFCCLVKINVNIQDLSDIYCISKAAITKRKYRIKTDKLGITDENISLDSFLKAF